RIRALGVGSVMGVPGDMNLELLDYINDVDGLNWIGNANELNAAYAADAYCRVKGCPGVIITTMGVGELSALNGVAGAYAEQVKIIHIVGTTPKIAREKRLMIHHSLGSSPDHQVYEKISHHVRAAHCWLDNPETAADEIDRVIQACYTESLPVYIFVPMDAVKLRALNNHHASLSLKPVSNRSSEAAAVTKALDLIYAAKSPSVIVDALVARHLAVDVARELVDLLHFPTFTTPMGKSIIHETNPYFTGVYNGQISLPDVCRVIEQESDLVIDLGPFLSDSNTGGHSRKLPAERVIAVNPKEVVISGVAYPHIGLKSFLEALLKGLDKSRLPRPSFPIIAPGPPASDADSTLITQSWIWKRLGKFVRANDILIAESGTAQFGLPDAQLPANVMYLTQLYYGSIGYATPACFGAAVAQKELGIDGRVILVVGDGSLQLTVQEVGTMIKCGLKNILIMVINNGGYTIERAIHGPEEAYNDIAAWNHQDMLRFFGAKDGKSCSREVRTKEEFEEISRLPEYTQPSSIQLLEIFMDVMDIPWRLKGQIELINAR
ncbi:pyruvate decarboxylase, partial [Cadophora sp. DSE1049]